MPIGLFGITHCTTHEPGSVRSQYVFRCSMIQTAIVAHQPLQRRHVLRSLATTHCQTSSVSLAVPYLHFASVVNVADTLGGFHARDSQRGRSLAASYLTATDLSSGAAVGSGGFHASDSQCRRSLPPYAFCCFVHFAFFE